MNDDRVDASGNLAVSHASEYWYAAYCKPRQEGVAEENLLRQGCRTYLPRICHKRRRKGQWVSKAEPLFPRYLFTGSTPPNAASPRYVPRAAYPAWCVTAACRQ